MIVSQESQVHISLPVVVHSTSLSRVYDLLDFAVCKYLHNFVFALPLQHTRFEMKTVTGSTFLACDHLKMKKCWLFKLLRDFRDLKVYPVLEKSEKIDKSLCNRIISLSLPFNQIYLGTHTGWEPPHHEVKVLTSTSDAACSPPLFTQDGCKHLKAQT